MSQRPLKKLKLIKKPTKYLKKARKNFTKEFLITKEINKSILEQFESRYGRTKREDIADENSIDKTV